LSEIQPELAGSVAMLPSAYPVVSQHYPSISENRRDAAIVNQHIARLAEDGRSPVTLSTYEFAAGGRSQPDFAASQQRDGTASLGQLAYHCPADAAACASHADHWPIYRAIAHANAVPDSSRSTLNPVHGDT
jgi:hypothetical protein